MAVEHFETLVSLDKADYGGFARAQVDRVFAGAVRRGGGVAVQAGLQHFKLRAVQVEGVIHMALVGQRPFFDIAFVADKVRALLIELLTVVLILPFYILI